MDAGTRKTVLSLIAVLAFIFGAVALAASVRAAGLVLGIMAAAFIPLALVTVVRIRNEAESNYLIHVAWYLALVFAGVAWLVSLKAALITVGVWLALLAVGFVVLLRRYNRELREKGGVDPSLFVEVHLSPRPDRSEARHPEAVEALAGELAALGFVSAGFFRDPETNIYVEGWVDPERKVMAAITETVPSLDVKFSEQYEKRLNLKLVSYYDGGASFGVIRGSAEWSSFPGDMTREYLEADLPAAEALAALLERRPAEGLFDVKPENFQATTEDEMTRVAKLNLANYYQEAGNPAVVEAPPLRLKPMPERGRRNLGAVEELAGELAALGFEPAGFFKIVGHELYVEGWADRSRKVYASICECGRLCPAYVEMTSIYAGRPGLTVSASSLPGALDLPEEFVGVNIPEARPAELLEVMLQRRPAEGLRDTPPEDFQAAFEEQGARIAEAVRGRAGGL